MFGPKRREDASHSESLREAKNGALRAFRTKCFGVRCVFASLLFANNTTTRLDAWHQTRAVADKQFVSGAPICRCNDRMASCRVAARQSQQTCGPRARRP